MADVGGAPRNLDFFGTFLKTISQGVTAAPEQTPSSATASSGARTATADPAGPADGAKALDTLLRILGERLGRVTIKDLVLATGWTLGAIVVVVEQLEKLRLAHLEGSVVQLTPDGTELAKHSAESSIQPP